jgi:hypothetical protein
VAETSPGRRQQRPGRGRRRRLVLIGSGALTAIIHALAVLLIAAAAIPVTAVSVIALAATRTRSESPVRPDGPAWVSREPPGMQPRLQVPHKPAIEPPQQPQAIEHHHHGPEFHIYGADGQEAAAALIRKALSGQAEDVIPRRTQR